MVFLGRPATVVDPYEPFPFRPTLSSTESARSGFGICIDDIGPLRAMQKQLTATLFTTFAPPSDLMLRMQVFRSWVSVRSVR